MGWRDEYGTVGACAVCDQSRPVGRRGLCRLCWRTAATARVPFTPLDVVGANRGGQQLFLANMRRRAFKVRVPPPRALARGPQARRVRHRQLDLFEQPRTWARRHGMTEPPDPVLAARLDALCCDHARAHGWGRNTTTRTRLALRIIQTLQPTPGEPFALSQINAQVNDFGWPARPVATILAEAGLLDDDRTPAVITWFETQLNGLPPLIADELRVWFDVLHNGSTVPPRSRPRADVTIRSRTNWAMPTIRSWAEAGHQSLREITGADIVAALPGSGSPRATLGVALRSIFKVLKGRKVIFVNPTARISTGEAESRQPLPVELGPLRDALDSPSSATAALTALIAFHGLRADELRRLQLTDVRDGRVHLPGRVVLLAEPAQQRVSRYLDDRNQRWPNSANPHLFINYRSALNTEGVGVRWLHLTLGRSPRSLREDRILDEAIATGGDIRRLTDLFGLSVKAATRYAAGIGHPDLTAHP
jgi:integrase